MKTFIDAIHGLTLTAVRQFTAAKLGITRVAPAPVLLGSGRLVLSADELSWCLLIGRSSVV